MARPRQTYGKKGTAEANLFVGSSSPLKAPALSSPLSSPPQSPVTRPRRQTARPTRVVCSDSDEAHDNSSDSDFEVEDDDSFLASELDHLDVRDSVEQSSPMNSPASNTRARARRPLQQRDANSSVLSPTRKGAKAVHPSVAALREESGGGDDDDDEDASSTATQSPHIRRQRNLRNRASLTPPKGGSSRCRAERRHTPLPGFHQRAPSPSLAYSVRPKQHKAQLSPLPLLEPKDAYTKPLLSLVAEPNGRTHPTPFQSWADDLAAFFTIRKLAEASYGEVYRLSLLPGTAPELRKTDESVLKLIALKPPPDRKLSKKERDAVAGMSRVADVAGEVRLLQRMTPVPGFTNFREVRVVRGGLPTQFVAAWRHYNAHVRRSEFPDPGLEGAYPSDQLWAVIEMQDAGQDLEPDEQTGPKVTTVFSVWDAFWSVTCAIGKGEEWAEYEHRDLHLGNVCIKDRSGGDWNAWPEVDRLDRKLGFTGLETTIIDYTLSRARMGDEDEQDGSCDPASPTRQRGSGSEALIPASEDDEPVDDSQVAFLNLSADPVLFEGSADVEYQYEIYRLMRNAVFNGDPTDEVLPTAPHMGRRTKKQQQKEAEEEARLTELWRCHHPLTNLVWLHYVLWKLCEGVAEWPSQIAVGEGWKPGQKQVHGRARELEECLGVLESMLDMESIGHMAREGGICSARELVAWAVGEGWLDQTDVLQCGLEKRPAGRAGAKTRQSKGKVHETEVDRLGDMVRGMGLR